MEKFGKYDNFLNYFYNRIFYYMRRRQLVIPAGEVGGGGDWHEILQVEVQ